MGRLLDIRVDAGFRTISDVDSLFEKVVRCFDSKFSAPDKGVTVADWRHCSILSGEAAEKLLVRMTRDNPRVMRSAALASRQSASAVMQFTRLIRESDSEVRRLFFEPEPLVRWFSEVLTVTEVARLRVFLDESSPNN
jgi:hypothetical protein